MRGKLLAMMTVLALTSAVYLWVVPSDNTGIRSNPLDHVEMLPVPTDHASPAPPPPDAPQNQQGQTNSTDQPTRFNRPPLTVLLMGVDQRPADRGRPDAMILARLDPDEKQVTLLSIPRDTYVPIADTGHWDKINHAYLRGISAVVNTVENFFGVPVDHYVLLNMEGFVKLVDALGGIRVNVEKPIISRVEPYVRLQAGQQRLNGRKALAYVRFRSDAENDYGRQRRQREVILAIISRVEQLGIRQMPQIIEVIRALGPHLKTDLTMLEVIRLAADFHSLSGKDVNIIQIKSQPCKIRGKWVVLIEQSERERIAGALSQRKNKYIGEESVL